MVLEVKPRLLDAFSCSGLGADGYAAAGWDVTCLDLDKNALKHNPHDHIQGDALKYLADPGFLSEFDAVHASPPCQGYSATRNLANAQGKGQGRAINLIPEVVDLLEAWGGPYIIENVPRSPLSSFPGVVQLCGSSWGLKVQRHRLFAPGGGASLTGLACDHSVFDKDPVTNKPRPWGVYYAKGDSIPHGGRTCLTLEHGMECMGVTREVPWKYLCEGLPPVMTEHLGKQLLEAL